MSSPMRSTVTLHVVSSLDGFIAKKDNSVSWMDSSGDIYERGVALPLHEAVALVERVQVSAERHAKLGLDAVAMTLPGRILGVALRQCPGLPPTIAERIKDHRAQNVADWVMYRKALATAAEARGWAVHWYDAKKVFDAASKTLRIEDIDAHFLQMRKSIGSPWGKDHKVAMAAAIVAARAR